MKKLIAITAFAVLAALLVPPEAAPAGSAPVGEPAAEYLYITSYNAGLSISRGGYVTEEAAWAVAAGELDIVKVPDMLRMTRDGEWERLPIH